MYAADATNSYNKPANERSKMQCDGGNVCRWSCCEMYRIMLLIRFVIGQITSNRPIILGLLRCVAHALVSRCLVRKLAKNCKDEIRGKSTFKVMLHKSHRMVIVLCSHLLDARTKASDWQNDHIPDLLRTCHAREILPC